MEIKAELVKTLREKTGAGFGDCKAALVEANGNVEEAVTFLRKRGTAQAAKKAGRSTKQGVIASYIHLEGRIGVLIEVNCESDFVARTDDFQTLVKELGMQVAAFEPEVRPPRGRPRGRTRKGTGDLPRAARRIGQTGPDRRQDRRRQARRLLRAGRAARPALHPRPDRQGVAAHRAGGGQAGREHRRGPLRPLSRRRNSGVEAGGVRDIMPFQYDGNRGPCLPARSSQALR